MDKSKSGMPKGFRKIDEDRDYWRLGRKLGYFDEFKFPKWMKGD